MSIAEMQDCLARLYVDASVRRLFIQSPESVLEKYRLSQREQAAVRKLDSASLERFAMSLKAQRRRRISRAYPALFTLAEHGVEHFFELYNDLYIPKPSQPIHQDCLDFGQYMERTLTAATEFADWVAELARYERMLYAMIHVPAQNFGKVDSGSLVPSSRPHLRRGIAIGQFQYDVLSIRASLPIPPDSDLEIAPCTIVFRAATRNSQPQMMRVSDSTRIVLQLCDGRHSIEEIIAETEAELAQTKLSDIIGEAITRLIELGVIWIESDSTQLDDKRIAGLVKQARCES